MKSTQKKPSWKIANGPTQLRNVGHVGVEGKRCRVENQIIADQLRSWGYEFWDHYCIADYSDFCGYVLSFRRVTDDGIRLWFDWRWETQGSDPFWIGAMRVALDVSGESDNKKHAMRPFFHGEINYITDQTIGNLRTFEDVLMSSYRSAMYLTTNENND